MRRLLVIAALLLALGLVSSIALAWAGATMWRVGWPDNLLTNTAFNQPTLELGEANQWRIAQWTDATLTRRWAWGWRPQWFEDPWKAHLLRSTTNGLQWDTNISADELPRFSRAKAPPPEALGPVVFPLDGLPTFLEREAGWPARCLRAWWEAGDNRIDLPGERLRGGVLATPWSPYGRYSLPNASMFDFTPEYDHALPLTPMWGGLAINTLAWAGLWLVTLLAAHVPIGYWRRRRWRARERLGLCARCRYRFDVADDPVTTCPECALILGRRPGRRLAAMPALAAVSLAVLTLATAGFGARRVMLAPRLPALHEAAARGNVPLVRSLLAAGAAADDPAPDVSSFVLYMQGARPIDWAALRGHAGVIDELLAAGANPGMVGDHHAPLALAIAARHDEAAERLLAAGASVADLPKNTFAPIAVAAWHDDAPLLERLFDEADAAGAGPVPLDLFLGALPNRSHAVKNMVLDRAASFPDSVEDLAVFAYRMGDLALLDELIARGFDPWPASAHFLAYAAHAEDPAAGIEALASRGVDLAAVDLAGNTALHLVASGGEAPEALRLLATMGHDPASTNDQGRTALHRAAASGHADNVRALLDLGANARALDHSGNTPRDLWWRGGRGTDEYDRIRNLLEAAEGSP